MGALLLVLGPHGLLAGGPGSMLGGPGGLLQSPGLVFGVMLLLLPPPGLQAGAAERRLISLLLEEGQEWNPSVHAVPEVHLHLHLHLHLHAISQHQYKNLIYNKMERPVIRGSESVPLEFNIA